MTSSSSGSPYSRAFEREIGFSLLRFAHWAESTNAYAARQMGLHVTDLSCIGYLDAQPGPVSAKQIVEYLGISSGSVTGLIDRLEESGYVRRIPNPDDRRSVLIQLNAEQAAEPLAFYLRLRSAFSDASLTLGQENLEKFIWFLDKLTAVKPIDLIE